MSELATEYEGQITARIQPAGSKEGVAAKIEYGWEQPLHGLVLLLPDGTVAANLPGHSYAKSVESAKAEVQAAVDKMLAESAK